MSSATTPTKIIDVETDAGKNFLKNVETLTKELNIVAKGDRIKQVRNLTPQQIEDNPFLKDFMEFSPVFKNFKLVDVSIGNFGRKSGYCYHPAKEMLFRFFIHIGDPELYYMDNNNMKDYMLPLKNGYGFIIPSYESTSSSITIYPDPIRVVNSKEVSRIVPKIRPRNYSRITMVYELEFIMPEDDGLFKDMDSSNLPENNEESIEETSDKTEENNVQSENEEQVNEEEI